MIAENNIPSFLEKSWVSLGHLPKVEVKREMTEKQKRLLIELLKTMYDCRIYETVDSGREVVCVAYGNDDDTFPEKYFHIEDGDIKSYGYHL